MTAHLCIVLLGLILFGVHHLPCSVSKKEVHNWKRRLLLI